MFRRLASATALALALASCSDTNLLVPTDDSGPFLLSPSHAMVDAANGGGIPGFYFLPPLADNPTIEGDFDPNLDPSMEVCELDGGVAEVLGGTAECTSTVVKSFAPGSAKVSGSAYTFDWNTRKVGEMDPSRFYRIRVLLEGAELGYLDINPQEPAPGTPGDDYPGLHAFRVGEKLPVKVFLSTAARCATAEGYVIQCTASAVFDTDGGLLSLDPEQTGWAKLSVVLPANALPGVDQITVTIERIDPVLFEQATGTRCIPTFDAPEFADCLRVTTDPVLSVPLEFPARIEMCIDPYQLQGLKFPVGQEERLQIIRFGHDGATQGLPTVDATTCGSVPAPAPSQVGLLPIPEENGLLRTAAISVNRVARLLAPEGLAAVGGIRLAGTTSNFSRFRWALPGAMVITDGDGVTLQSPTGADVDTPATIQVVDAEGFPVEGATVHFSNGDDVTTGANGVATTTWTVPGAPGEHTLTATAFGLQDGTVADNETLINFDFVTVTFTATVIGPPASFTQSPTTTLTGTVGQPASEPLVITINDQAGQPVSGASVTWTASGDGTLSGGTVTDDGGSASADWVLATTSGTNTATAVVGGLTVQFTAEGAPSDPATIIAGAATDAPVATAQVLTVTVQDQFGNLVPDAEVTWTATGGAVVTPSITSAAGEASSTWTLPTAAGDYTATATTTVGGLVATFFATALPGEADHLDVTGDAQTATVGSDVEISLVVRDTYDNVREGDEVTWSTSDGTTSAAATTTDSNGSAGMTWTLGTIAGGQTLSAGVGGLSHTFTATATPGAATSLAVTPAAPGSAFVGSTIPVTATVTDAFGNARAGDAVTWSVTTGAGSVSGAGATDASGAAAASWTLGTTPGANTLTVNAGGLLHTFEASGYCVDGYGTANVDGTMSSPEWACAQSAPFTANISGGAADALVYWMNDGANLYLAVKVRQSSLEKVNDVRFDFDNGNGVHDEGDDAIGLVASSQSFFDEYLSRKCANSGQAGCGSSDGGAPDGEGRLTNDGTWTTYELAHPLNSGSARDFSLNAGDPVGFFLTLNIGNGAQGNTQFPGFRVFHPISIRSLP